MERMQLEDKVLWITIPIRHSLKGSDFIVDAFDGAAGDREVIPVENARPVSLQSLRHGLQDFDSRCSSATTPVGQEFSGADFVELLPDLTQIVLEVIGRRKGLVQSQSFLEPSPFIL